TILSAVTSACPTPSTKPPPPTRLNQSLSLLSFCESPLYVPLHRPSFSMADLDAPQIKSRIVKRLRIPDEKIILMLADDMAVMNILLNHKLTGTEKMLRFSCNLPMST
ncbi:unnamed protein product, partial [Thlaspi arvense]